MAASSWSVRAGGGAAGGRWECQPPAECVLRLLPPTRPPLSCSTSCPHPNIVSLFVLLYHDPHQVQEQRLTGLIQALLCGACLAATPVISPFHDPHHQQVQEQRLTGLIQALLCGACLAATPVIKQIPTAVMWGYFIFMAIGERQPAAGGARRLT